MKKTRIWTAAVIAAAIFTLCCYFMPFLKFSLDIFGEQIGTTSVSGFDTLKAALDGEFPYNGWYVIGFAGAVLALLFAVIALAKRGILVCTMLFGAASIAGTAFSVGKCIDYLGELYTAGAGFVLLIIAAALTIVLCVVTLALPKPAGMPVQPWQQQPWQQPVQQQPAQQPVQPVQQQPVQPAQAAFCKNCGAKMPPDAGFCTNCGAKRS